MPRNRHNAAAFSALSLLSFAAFGCSSGDAGSTQPGSGGTSGGLGGSPSTGGTPPTGGAGGSSAADASGGATAGTGASGGTSGTGSGGTSSSTVVPRKRRIAVGDIDNACAVAADRSVVCWGGRGSVAPPSGETGFDALAAREADVCGRKLDGSIVCWSDFDTSPSGTFADFNIGVHFACALRTSDGAPECWSDLSDAIPSGAPQEAFVEVEAGGSTACARRGNGSLVCWGTGQNGLTSPPGGSFLQIALSSIHGCAIGAGGTECWGLTGAAAPAQGTILTQVAAGASGTCGLLPDGSIRCWAQDNAQPLLDAPTGRFVEVAVGSDHACAIREDARVECWPPFIYPLPVFNALVD